MRRVERLFKILPVALAAYIGCLLLLLVRHTHKFDSALVCFVKYTHPFEDSIEIWLDGD